MSTVHEILSKHLLADGFPIVMDMEKSHGSYLVDQKEMNISTYLACLLRSPLVITILIS